MQMGHDREQIHEITCPACHEDFIVALDVDFENITFKPRCIENCEPGSEEGLVINVDPTSPMPDTARHKDLVFPWLQHAREALNVEELIKRVPKI